MLEEFYPLGSKRSRCSFRPFAWRRVEKWLLPISAHRKPLEITYLLQHNYCIDMKLNLLFRLHKNLLFMCFFCTLQQETYSSSTLRFLRCNWKRFLAFADTISKNGWEIRFRTVSHYWMFYLRIFFWKLVHQHEDVSGIQACMLAAIFNCQVREHMICFHCWLLSPNLTLFSDWNLLDITCCL